jgi:hypothetical protein
MFSSNGSEVGVPVNYIEDVFSTTLYAGNGASRTITTGIDVSGKDGLVWVKGRDVATQPVLSDSVTGAGNYLSSNSTAAQTTNSFGVTSFTSTGFGITSGDGQINASPYNYVAWTFRKQPKFFDVVTWTGDNSSTRQINHNLGATPAFIIIKRTDISADWVVAALNSSNSYENLRLNTTAASPGNFGAYPTGSAYTSPTQLGVGWWFQGGFATLAEVNALGGTYVAYLFAHNSGGFGPTGADNVISCGSFTTDGSGNIPAQTLGYEPQWIMYKRTDGTDSWRMFDVMRGWFNNTVNSDSVIQANLSNPESFAEGGTPTANGFVSEKVIFPANATYIYMAIRRGPMRVPTTGTSVFNPVEASSGFLTTNFPVDMQWSSTLDAFEAVIVVDRLRRVSTTSTEAGNGLTPAATVAETSGTGNYSLAWNNVGFQVPSYNSGFPLIFWNFRRAPGFFDEVCYTGNGVAGTVQKHNLGVAPEFMIIKYRNNTQGWFVFHSFGASIYRRQFLNTTESTGAVGDYSYGSGGVHQKPDATNFYLEAVNANQSGGLFIAYLFATCPGVSKVGSYTGNGSSQTIDCGFTGGVRFVLIKRTDNTGDWYVWDTARGIIAGNDPHLSLNTQAAEVTTDDSIDNVASGFIANQVAATNINVTSATYIFLAIA